MACRTYRCSVYILGRQFYVLRKVRLLKIVALSFTFTLIVRIAITIIRKLFHFCLPFPSTTPIFLISVITPFLHHTLRFCFHPLSSSLHRRLSDHADRMRFPPYTCPYDFSFFFIVTSIMLSTPAIFLSPPHCYRYFLSEEPIA